MLGLLVVMLMPLWADQVAESFAHRPADQKVDSVPSTYGKYLGCLNQLVPPIARAVNETTTEVGPLDRRPALFAGVTRGRTGMLLIAPDAATLDAVPIYTPTPGRPRYSFSYVAPNGREQLWIYFVSPKTQRGVTSVTGSDMRKRNPNVPFPPIGRPKSRISIEEAVEALENETLPRLRSMPGVSQRQVSGTDYSGRIKKALCSCIGTGSGRIKAKAQQIGVKLKITDLEACDSAVISDKRVSI